jgi:hypothetical protein
MQKIVFCLILFVSSITVFGQEQPKNSIKFNVVGPLSQLYSLQYERALNDKWAFNNTFFYRQKSLIPFGVPIDTLAKRHGVGLTGIKFEYIFMNEARVGVMGYSPEIRKYFGENKNRWFVSAFGQFEKFDMTVPASLAIKYQGLFLDAKSPVDFTFRANSIGLLVGKQFRWSNFGVDFVIIGPHLGFANTFNATATNEVLGKLSEDEKTYLKDKIIERFGLSNNYFSLNITDEKAEIKSIRSIPYFSIRGAGLNLFYRF